MSEELGLDYAERIEKLEAENERLRMALRIIKSGDWHFSYVHQVAKQALEGTP